MANLNRREFLQALALLAAGAGCPSHLRKALGGDLWEGSEARSASKPGTPNILILVFDALATKNMSLYGYKRETTPNFARFAEKATVYHAHYSAGNFTTPGTASLLTGSYPWSHRALHLHGIVANDYVNKSLFRALSAGQYHRIGYSHNLLVTSLLYQFRRDLEVLKKTRDLCLVDDEFADRVFSRDYNAAFWSEWLLLRGDGSAPGSLFLSMFHRLLRRTDKNDLLRKYGELFPRGLPELHSLYFMLEDAIDWIENLVTVSPQPFLAYVHLLPPHQPYTARRDFVDRFRDGWNPPAKPRHPFARSSDQEINRKRREYDEYLAYADAEFGRLYDFMLHNGVLDNTCVIVTSDHGELFERGIWGHITHVLYEPVIRIPLLISKPGQSQRQDVTQPTNCVDLAPTLLHMTGQAVPDWCEGRVLPGFSGEEAGEQASVFAVEAKSNPIQAPLTKATVALIKGPYKLIRYLGYPKEPEYLFYNLANDPEELENLYRPNHTIAAELQDELDRRLKEVNQPWESS